MTLSIIKFISDFGDLALLLPIAAAIQVWLLRAPEGRRSAAIWAISLLFCCGATALLKIYFSACPYGGINSPSGHAALSVFVYGGLGAIVGTRARRSLKFVLAAAGVGLVVAILATRVILGAHSIAEVLIGSAVGVMALAPFAEAVIRHPVLSPTKSLVIVVILIAVVLHDKDVQVEGLLRLLGTYLHSFSANICL
jgi:membrane-associated phospholipid phosphatase